MYFNSAFSEESIDLFNKANSLYQKGNFKEAIKYYEKIVNYGYNSGEVFYNLGNSYYRLKKYPYAILNFERAKRINPSDEDIDFNLKIANLQIVDKIEPLPKFFITEWFEGIRDTFSSSTWAIFTTILFWITLFSLALFWYLYSSLLRRVFFSLGIVGIAFTIISLTFSYQMYNKETHHTEGIIFTPTISVKSAPDESGTDIFILHEGTKVSVLDSLSNWKKIRIANGNVGWIHSKEFEII